MSANEPNATLHGGKEGFDKRDWVPAKVEHGVRYTLFSPDGDQGFPGAMDVSATGISVLASAPIAVGERVRLEMAVPGREWAGEVSVARVVSQSSDNGFDQWLVGLRFEAESAHALPDLAPYQISAAA